MNWLVQAFLYLALSVTVLIWYIFSNDRRLSALPAAALKYSPKRFTASEVRETYKRLREEPHDVLKALPPRTGRRYIVVGGVSLL